MDNYWSGFLRWMASRAAGVGKDEIAKSLRWSAPHVTCRPEAMIACMSTLTLNSEEFDLYVRKWQAAGAPATSDPPPVHGVTAPIPTKQWEYDSALFSELQKLGKAGWKAYAVDGGYHYIRRRVRPAIEVKNTLRRKVASIAPEQSAPTDVPPTHGLVSDGEADLRRRLVVLVGALRLESKEATGRAIKLREVNAEVANGIFGQANAAEDTADRVRAILFDIPPVHGAVPTTGAQ